ncbi:MAG TPA: FAD-binding protein, partial [Acidimicrobiales bacterium]
MENPTLRSEILAIVNADAVTFVGHHHPDDLHDESLHAAHVEPFAVVRPSNTQQVSEIAKLASRHGLPLTPRGSGTGLSGAATPVPGGIVISFSRMNQLLEVDVDDHVAVVQPGIT